jgi:phosphoenolpyruvate-protein phosphotransferase (PTS system enzyme I)
MISHHGFGLGGGIAIGKARIVRAGLVAVPHYVLAPQHRESEVKRLFAAIDSARDELREVGAHLKLDAPPEAKALLEVHEVMLNDPALGFGAQERILDEGLNAQWAWSVQIDTLVQQFGSLDDAYLRERARDVEQIGQRGTVALKPKPIRFDSIIG